jgi:hypothetical protein
MAAATLGEQALQCKVYDLKKPTASNRLHPQAGTGHGRSGFADIGMCWERLRRMGERVRQGFDVQLFRAGIST